MSAENVEAIRRLFKAVEERDLAGFLAVYDPELVIRETSFLLHARQIQECCSTRAASPDYAPRSEGDRAMNIDHPAFTTIKGEQSAGGNATSPRASVWALDSPIHFASR